MTRPKRLAVDIIGIWIVIKHILDGALPVETKALPKRRFVVPSSDVFGFHCFSCNLPDSTVSFVEHSFEVRDNGICFSC
jgi:hypothetical protein